MNLNPSAGSSRSPERTRPRLFSGSLALRAASSLRAEIDEAPRVHRSPARRRALHRRDPLVPPNSESTARSARTSPRALPASDRIGPVLRAYGDTLQDTAGGIWAPCTP